MSNGVVQEGAGVAKAVVTGLNSSPVLLLIVVLNVVAMGAAVYYLVHIDTSRQATVSHMIELLSACVMQSVQDRKEGP